MSSFSSSSTGPPLRTLVDHEPFPRTSLASSDSGPLVSTPDEQAPGKKKIPKVAVYVSGAAFALTLGLTALVFPHVRRATLASAHQAPSFASHRYPSVPSSVASSSSSRPFPPHLTAPKGPLGPLPEDLPLSSSSSSSTPISFPPPPLESFSATAVDPSLEAARSFNDAEERTLYGQPVDSSAEGQDAQRGSALDGFKALGAATALVLGTAGTGATLVGWLMGVGSPAEFAREVRAGLHANMPGLVDGVRDTTAGRADVEVEAFLKASGQDGRDGVAEWLARGLGGDEVAGSGEATSEAGRAE